MMGAAMLLGINGKNEMRKLVDEVEFFKKLADRFPRSNVSKHIYEGEEYYTITFGAGEYGYCSIDFEFNSSHQLVRIVPNLKIRSSDRYMYANGHGEGKAENDFDHVTVDDIFRGSI